MKRKVANLAECPVFIRLGIFVLILLLLWLPLAAPIYWLDRDPNQASILTILLLYGEFILLVRFWVLQVHRQSHVFKHYGLERTQRNASDIIQGLSISFFAILSLFVLEGWLGWLTWQSSLFFLPHLVLEGLVVALGFGFAEELLFRGWLLDELQRDYRKSVALWTNSFLYALLHFIKPLAAILSTWPQFPALLLLGLTLVWAKRSRRNRLGLPIGLHAGLVWGYYIINVGQLVQYSGRVPDWVTGVDRNPLAGVMGLLFLSSIAVWMRRKSLAVNSRG